MSEFPGHDQPPKSPFASPQHGAAYPSQGAPAGDATGGVIPYKNVPALIAYYLAVFSLLPCVGVVLGGAALILGIVGLQKRRRNPAVKGSVHAWIGIILGGGCAVLWGAAIAIMVFAAFRS